MLFVRVARGAVSFLVGVIVTAAMAQTGSIATCVGNCEPASRHKLSMCTFSNGLVNTRTVSNLSVSDLATNLQMTCGEYAAAHSNASWTSTFESCTPDTTVPFASSGGPSKDFKIDGTLKKTFTNGDVEYQSGPWWTAVCSCNDAINSNNRRIGTDAQCQCPVGMVWSEQGQACASLRDRMHLLEPPKCLIPQGGNPIFPLSGNKRQDESIPLGAGFGSLTLNYDTQLSLPAAGGAFTFAPFRPPHIDSLWATSIHRKLVLQSHGATQPPAVQADRGVNRWVSFTRNAAGLYVAMPGVADSLVQTASGWRYTDAVAGAQEDYDSAGNLLKVVTTSGAIRTYVYSTASTPSSVAPVPGLLIAVNDEFGRSVGFNYEQPPIPGAFPRITKIIDPQGRETVLGYANSRLASITWPDSTKRQFLYEVSGLPWAVTGVLDELNVRWSTYGYDGTGRAVSTEYAGAKNRYSLSWSVAPQWSVVTSYDAPNNIIWRDHYLIRPEAPVMRQPNLVDINYGTALFDGNPRASSQSQPAGAGCSASTSSSTFDVNGNLASNDNFNGTRSCFVNDLARNVQTQMVEGLANTVACSSVNGVGVALPAGSRKTTTQWHTKWLLKTKVAEPGRLVTQVFNGQPDPFNGNAVAACSATPAMPDGTAVPLLCKRVEQATTDANGALGLAATVDATVLNRVWAYTYNQYGKLLTENGPRTDVTDQTTYTYYPTTTADYTAGDLQKITNAVAKETLFTKYNKLGQVLEQRDPNLVVTTMSYDLRQRLTSVTIDGKTTVYRYDAAGQLDRLTSPDASYVGYEYDAAHRLSATFDNLGNRVEYLLDDSGNRLAERYKDPAGVLRRQLTRTVDALNRIDKITGQRGTP